MPGPVSDSYDPEFGTGANAALVHDAICEVIPLVDRVLNSERKNIVEVAAGEGGPALQNSLTEKEWRIVRFCLHRAKETI